MPENPYQKRPKTFSRKKKPKTEHASGNTLPGLCYPNPTFLGLFPGNIGPGNLCDSFFEKMKPTSSNSMASFAAFSSQGLF
ncbi:uncharacterized protein G2W53_039729 [Senna tora]|uniref:Uncharacterized protein n=1 Tax=Senna tora TaxID=362788 RepID=A0A834SR11_9FABA|nr:uncharacterized protein G2W53_039729 [Senna tora]